MSIAVQILSIVTLSIIVLSFSIVISRIITISSSIDRLILNVQSLTIKKGEEIELREDVESFSPKNTFGSYEHANALSEEEE